MSYNARKRSKISRFTFRQQYETERCSTIIKKKEDTYSKWERGINDFSVEFANELANLYNVSLDYLFGLCNNSEKCINRKINNSLIKERLILLRKEKKLTQIELSQILGYHQRTYAHYETGDVLPTIYKLYYIALYYDVSLDYLSGRSNRKNRLG